MVITTSSKAAFPIALDSSAANSHSPSVKQKNTIQFSAKAYEAVSGKKMNFLARLKFSIAKKLLINKMKKKFDGIDELLGMGPMGLAAAMSILTGLGGLVFFFFGNDDDGKKYKIGAAIGIGMNLIFWATGVYPLLAGLFGLLGFALAG